MIEWSYVLGATPPAVVPLGPKDFSGKPRGGIQYVQLALDPATGDVLVPMRWIRGPDAVVQRIRIRLKFWKGEWFLDRRQGIPYRTAVVGKHSDKTLVTAVFREVVTKTPGVARVEIFVADFDAAARLLTVSFRAYLTDGVLIVARNEPFIIGG